jgi:uncharacterized membrane protein
MKKSRVTKKGRKIILTSMLLALCLVITFVTISYAEEIYDLSITASVPPHYNVTANGNNLAIETNMKVFINGVEVKY